MPTYEYHCKHCKKDFEITIMSYFEKYQMACPSCGSVNIQKKLNKPYIIFKGDGFTKSVKENE